MAFTLHPVEGHDFVNREVLLKDMLTTLGNRKSRLGFALYGRRRIGKTSLILEVCRRLKRTDYIVPIYFSLWDLIEGTAQELEKKLTVTLLHAYRKKISLKVRAKNLLKAPLGLLKDTLSQLQIEIKVKDLIEILLVPKKGRVDFDNLFRLPEELARETKTKCVLFMDEFPSLLDLKDNGRIGEGVIRKIRTICEGYKHTVLCISGSIRKTMETVVLSPVSAFYRQFIIKEIRSLDEGALKKIITSNLQKPVTGKALRKIHEYSKGIPFYIQFLGRELEISQERKIGEEAVEKALEQLLKEEADIIFKEEFERLSPKERKVLLNIAQTDISSPSRIAQQIDEDPATVRKNLQYLTEKGVLEREKEGYYLFTDPIFMMWLKGKEWTLW